MKAGKKYCPFSFQELNAQEADIYLKIARIYE